MIDILVIEEIVAIDVFDQTPFEFELKITYKS